MLMASRCTTITNDSPCISICYVYVICNWGVSVFFFFLLFLSPISIGNFLLFLNGNCISNHQGSILLTYHVQLCKITDSTCWLSYYTFFSSLLAKHCYYYRNLIYYAMRHVSYLVHGLFTDYVNSGICSELWYMWLFPCIDMKGGILF